MLFLHNPHQTRVLFFIKSKLFLILMLMSLSSLALAKTHCLVSDDCPLCQNADGSRPLCELSTLTCHCIAATQKEIREKSTGLPADPLSN